MHFSCPHEYQLDSKDCGPACIKIIAKYYGRFFSLQYLRDICGVSGKSTILVPHIPFVFNPRIKYYSFVLVRLMQLYEIEYFGGLKRQGEKGHVNLEMLGHGIVVRWDQCAWIFQ